MRGWKLDPRRAVVCWFLAVSTLSACRNGERLREVVLDTPLIGQPLPVLELTDLGHQPVSLAAMRGRNLVVNLWATWCVPCREEMPELEALQAQYPREDISVVGLSFDHIDPALVIEFLEANEITYTNYLADGLKVLEVLGLSPGIPHTLLIDRDGIVRGHWQGRFRPFEPNTAEVLRSIVAG